MTAPSPVCYLRGTRVRTTKTGRTVEDLKIGERVVILSGDSKPRKPSKPVSKPIKWIGRQRFEKKSERWPANLEPVRISRFALDERTPHRDLYLSPNHAVYINGVLVPAKYLINGTSIVQAMPEGVEEIEYFHIELETHEVIFAEGVAAETLLVVKEGEAFADLIREQFDNFAERKRLYSNDVPAMTPFAPRVCYNGRRSELKAFLRRAVYPLVDVRDPIQSIHDQIAARANNSTPMSLDLT